MGDFPHYAIPDLADPRILEYQELNFLTRNTENLFFAKTFKGIVPQTFLLRRGEFSQIKNLI